MSKKKFGAIATMLIAAFALITTPVSALEWWEQDFNDAGGYSGDTVYLGRGSAFADGMTKEEFEASKPLLQTIEGVSITRQPEPAYPTWPEGATFSFEISNPNNVPLHYQWSISDGTNVIQPAGATGTSITMPSTYISSNYYSFCCIIKDDNDNVLYTDEVELEVQGQPTNIGENKPIVYIGEYAILPGESLKLEDTAYGENDDNISGTISFDENGTDITFDNVQMNDPEAVIDWGMAMTQGFLLINTGYKVPEPEYFDPADYEEMPTEYHLHFIGDNVITNSFFDEVGAGNIFQTFFSATNNSKKPTVYFEGDGTLTLNGGSYNYISDGHLNIGIDINAKSNDLTHFGDAYGIQALDITVGKDTELILDNHSTSLRAYSSIDYYGSLAVEDGASISATINPGIGGNMYTGNDFITAEAEMTIKNAELWLKGKADIDLFSPDAHKIHHIVGISAGEKMTLDGVTADIDIEVPKGEDGMFAANIMGIKTGVALPNDEKTLLTINNSDINININAPESVIVSGLSVGNNADIKNSNIITNVIGVGQVTGVSAANGYLNVTDSNISAEAQGAPYDDAYGQHLDETYGIVGAPLTIDITDDDCEIYAKTNSGAAIVSANTDERLEDEDARPIYSKDFTPELFILKNKAKILTPTDGVISGYTYNTNWGNEDYAAETIYSLKDTSNATLEALIAVEKKTDGVPNTDTGGAPNSGANTKHIDPAIRIFIAPFIALAVILGLGLAAILTKKSVSFKK